MIKLYLLYLFLGLYIFFESLAVWLLSIFSKPTMITDIALIASFALFVIVSILSLYRVKMAAMAGLICLLCVFPFGIHWLVFMYENEYFTAINTENTLVYIAIVLYIVSLFYTIKLIISPIKIDGIALKKYLRISLVAIPLVLFLSLMSLIFFDK